jgi:tetratricopeptide (TPR) repeat protein
MTRESRGRIGRLPEFGCHDVRGAGRQGGTSGDLGSSNLCGSLPFAKSGADITSNQVRPLYNVSMTLRVVSLAFFLALTSCSPEATKQRYVSDADKLFSSGKYVEAAELYQKAIAIDPRLAHAYYGRGRCLLHLGNYNEAGGALHRAAELLPPSSSEYRDIDTQLAYALVHSWDDRQLAEVERVGVDLCKRDPKSFDGRRLLGDLSLIRARKRATTNAHLSEYYLDDALGEYRIALNVRPNDAYVALQLARALAVKGLLTESEQKYRAAIQLDKSVPDTYAELYRLLLAQEKLPEAEAVLQSAILDVPSHQGFALMLAAQTLVTNPNMAPPVIEQLKSKDTGLRAATLIAGDFYTRAGQLDRAKQEFGRCVAAKQFELACRVRLIRIATFENNQSDLEKLVKETLQLDRNNPAARTAGAVLKLKAGDTETAERELRKLLDMDTDGPVARYYLARIQARQGLLADASQTLELALQRQPDLVQARLLLARVQLSLRDYGDARRSAEAVLASHSENAQAKELLEAAKAAGMGPRSLADFYISEGEISKMDGLDLRLEPAAGASPLTQPIRLQNSVCDAAVAAFNKLRAKDYERYDLVTDVPGVWSTAALTTYIGN